MDAFVIRKRKSADGTFERVEPSRPVSRSANLTDEYEHEPTDVKLAILMSKFPKLDPGTLLDILIAHEGSVSLATSVLVASTSGHDRKPSTIGMQGTLRQFQIAPGNRDDSNGSDTYGSKKINPAKKRTTLHLYDVQDIIEHTPCTVIHNFLPAQLANNLLKELLAESESFKQDKFKLFDNVVVSAHTNAFYIETWDEEREQRTSYNYNEKRIKDVRLLIPNLATVKPLVAKAVNAAIRDRISKVGRLPFQPPGSWCPNVALVNCYRGPKGMVGWHTDQLTYLGPRAVIGSLSLGVAREFRVRRILGYERLKDASTKEETPDGTRKEGNEDLGGQISIHLPHNSLLIMHADMQEEWKHAIVPATSIDPHPISGSVRINITYRDYKSYMHPRHTPLCKCRVPCVLRVVQQKKETKGKYFWMCYTSYVPGKSGCDTFTWAGFDDYGRPLNMRNPGLMKNEFSVPISNDQDTAKAKSDEEMN